MEEHRIDLIEAKSVVVELKSVEKIDPVFEAQVLAYLEVAKLKVRLLINSNSHYCIMESRGLCFDLLLLRVPVTPWQISLL